MPRLDFREQVPPMSSDRSAGLILVLNCGSSSIKFALFDAGTAPLPRRPSWNGKVDSTNGAQPTFGETGVAPAPVALDPAAPYASAVEHIRRRVYARLEGRRLAGVVHRVVHGGSRYFEPIRVDAAVIADLRSYVPLAPLHQPFALDAIDALQGADPGLPHFACFDTAFHHTIPKVEQMMALPYSAWERGLRRYGFHGLSYEFISIALAERYGERARGRVIVAHLGSGASLCAMQGLRSVATTMGFSALDGLMMGSRCGALDPGVVLYLMGTEKRTLEQVANLLYNESGLLGVSCVSPDPRVLLPLEAGDERVRVALELYVRRIVREIGALTAVLGGLDMLVFTAGIGEHNAEIRARVCAKLEFLGVELDAAANAAVVPADGPRISTAESNVLVAVERTNEEWVAAVDAARLLGLSP